MASTRSPKNSTTRRPEKPSPTPHTVAMPAPRGSPVPMFPVTIRNRMMTSRKVSAISCRRLSLRNGGGAIARAINRPPTERASASTGTSTPNRLTTAGPKEGVAAATVAAATGFTPALLCRKLPLSRSQVPRPRSSPSPLSGPIVAGAAHPRCRAPVCVEQSIR